MTKAQLAEKIFHLEEMTGTIHTVSKEEYIKKLTKTNSREQLEMSLSELQVFSELTAEKPGFNKIFGYCRVSTKTQNLDRQVRNITAEYPEADIRKEAFTGTKIEGRTELIKILKEARTGDTIIFDSVSRMSRNAEEGTELYFRLYDSGINLVFLKERHIDTDAYKKALEAAGVEISTDGTAAGDLVSDVVKAINKFMRAKAADDIKKAFDQAQKEVDDNRQRTREGIETARRSGKQIGRIAGKRAMMNRNGELTQQYLKEGKIKDEIRNKAAIFGGHLNDNECMKIIGISRGTYYKYKKELMEEKRRYDELEMKLALTK